MVLALTKEEEVTMEYIEMQWSSHQDEQVVAIYGVIASKCREQLSSSGKVSEGYDGPHTTDACPLNT